jgi:hypothetical protein
VRAIGGSTLFHAALLLLASLTVITVALPRDPTDRRVLRGEIGPVDNRARTIQEAGGSPGALGGEGRSESDDVTQLLEEVLTPLTSTDLPRWLRPRGELGRGVQAGPGPGGGGGEGGGSGGGVGSGVGTGTEFFGTKETANSYVYVIDRSGSMANRDSLEVAKRELLASLDPLSEQCRFAVVFYDTQAVFADGATLKPATLESKSRLHARLATILPDGGTDHKTALLAALKLQPEVVFFLTDADLMTESEARDIQEKAGASRIQAIEFGVGPNVGQSKPLRQLALGTGGSYRYLDVTTFR